MSIKFYMDVQVRREVTEGLRSRGVDVMTAQEDKAAELEDSDLLDRATVLGRVLFSQADDLLRLATRRQHTGEYFAGLIYSHQLSITIGQCVDDLELIAKATEPEEWINYLAYLPFR
jgi:predicted nuclease of predicted toxin-antitoxin system